MHALLIIILIIVAGFVAWKLLSLIGSLLVKVITALVVIGLAAVAVAWFV